MAEALSELRKLIAQGKWGYHLAGPQSSEPAALACLALCSHGRVDEATSPAKWLASLQTEKGSIGVTADQQTPAWPTSLAILAWQAIDQATSTNSFAPCRNKALQWALTAQGKAAPQHEQIGHDTTLLGWSWAEATHSWLEPTCLFVLALKASGENAHPRTREGVRIVVDRQLNDGGCNYGNTRVLGQETMPHIQPTGLAMLTLSQEPVEDVRIQRSLRYLQRAVQETTATASLCYGLLGLTAHDLRPRNAQAMLNQAIQRDSQRQTLTSHKLALLTLAGQENLGWLPGANQTNGAARLTTQPLQKL